MTQDDNMISALKRERAVYESRGDTDRVRQVDEQLRHYQGDQAGEPEPVGPDGRTGPDAAQRTADSAAGKAAAKKAPAKKTAASKPPAAPAEKPATPPAE